MRVMALDLGDSRIGIALSDPMKIIANGYETYTRIKDERDFTHIVNIVKEKEVEIVVIGLPINMDGTMGERVEKSKVFGEKLKPLLPENVKIDYIDERLTTVSAEKMLIDADVRRDKRKTVIDKIAATIILQSYLDKYSK
ncbi:MAG: Holliday junction resolvase RuvX [Clostridia bacterium]|nr:Holliday junction resolvase RuvX [Clostridia bacterium]